MSRLYLPINKQKKNNFGKNTNMQPYNGVQKLSWKMILMLHFPSTGGSLGAVWEKKVRFFYSQD